MSKIKIWLHNLTYFWQFYIVGQNVKTFNINHRPHLLLNNSHTHRYSKGNQWLKKAHSLLSFRSINCSNSSSVRKCERKAGDSRVHLSPMYKNKERAHRL